MKVNSESHNDNFDIPGGKSKPAVETNWHASEQFVALQLDLLNDL